MSWEDRDYARPGGSDMGGYGYQPQMRMRFGPRMSPTIKTLIIINVVVFILDFLSSGRLKFLAFNPYFAIKHFYIWQFVTYMFMHGGLWHLAFNMLPLWMFGSDLERKIGRENFITVYFLSGLLGVMFFTLSHLSAISNPSITTLVGASGAVLGVMVAFAMIYPERRITLLVMFVIPISIKAKHIVMGIFILEVLSELNQATVDNVAHLTHLGGMFFAYLYMKFKYGLSLPFSFTHRLGWQFKDFFYRKRYWRSKRNKYKPVDSDAFINDEIDPILEKISKYGIKSLTWRERRTLKRARSKMR